MTEDDIEFMAMGIPDAQAALAGGSVDAVLLAGPTAYNMEKDGYYVVTDGEALQRQPSLLQPVKILRRNIRNW